MVSLISYAAMNNAEDFLSYRWELVLMKGASTGALKVILLGGDDPR
jgi:hypothetical protein